MTDHLVWERWSDGLKARLPNEEYTNWFISTGWERRGFVAALMSRGVILQIKDNFKSSGEAARWVLSLPLSLEALDPKFVPKDTASRFERLDCIDFPAREFQKYTANIEEAKRLLLAGLDRQCENSIPQKAIRRALVALGVPKEEQP